MYATGYGLRFDFSDLEMRKPGRRTLLTAERKERLRRLLSEQPDATLAELGARMDRPFRTSTMDLWLRQLARASFLTPNTLHTLWNCSRRVRGSVLLCKVAHYPTPTTLYKGFTPGK